MIPIEPAEGDKRENPFDRQVIIELFKTGLKNTRCNGTGPDHAAGPGDVSWNGQRKTVEGWASSWLNQRAEKPSEVLVPNAEAVAFGAGIADCGLSKPDPLRDVRPGF